MEENNKLKISDYLSACIDFEKAPNKDKLKEIGGFVEKLNFREYIPLKEKEILVMRIMTSLSKDFDAPGASAFIEMGKVGIGLLSYCTNLNVDVNLVNLMYHSYDLLHTFGFVEAALKRCGKDYNVFVSMVDRAVGFDNFYRIIQTAALFDSESYDKWVATMNDLKTTMDQETLKSLMNTVNTEDETSKSVLQEMQKMAVQNVNEALSQEREKTRKAIQLLEKSEDPEI